jgi:hypothetical protein
LLLIAWGLPADAQDSVGGVLAGKCGGASGLACNDAQDPFDNSTSQSYVVDLGQYPTSWGNWYGYAPISKASRNQDALFFNNLLSAQAASRRFAVVQDSASTAYDLWAAQGFGPGNAQTSVQAPEGDLYRFGAVAADFGGSANNIVSVVAEVSPRNYNRLYVTRYESAVAQATSGGTSTGQFGVGAVDANGNPHFRAEDDNTSTQQPPPYVQGNNWITVNNALRTPGLPNQIFNDGLTNTAADAGATNYIVINSTTTHPVPSVIDAPGFAPLTAGVNFNDQYAYSDGTPPGVITTSANRPGTTNQRGTPSYTHTYTALGNGVSDAGSMAVLTKSNAGGGVTDSISVWGVNADGSVDGTVLLTLPAATISDPTDGFVPAVRFSATGEFDHYRSQVPFSGGTGQVALAADRSNPDILYAAATVYSQSSINPTPIIDPYNYIAVCRYDRSDGSQQWTIAAYNTFNEQGLPGTSGSCDDPGKPVLDGPGGNVIGRILPMFTVTGGTPAGPSMSAPMLDTEGNVYFMSAWERFLDLDTNGTCDAVDTDSGLFKAHRLPNGGYELENIISLGSTIYGPNSDTRYALRFMGVADSNSVSSGTIWSGNIVQDRLPGTLVNSLDTFDMGGFVVNISVVYDVDKDGDYERPTGTSPDDPTSADEAYEQLIYVRGVVRTGACCVAESCQDVTQADCEDLEGEFHGFGTVCEFTDCGPTQPACGDADVNCDGAVNAGDLLSVRAPGTWQSTGAPGFDRADVNNDGAVNAGDLLSIRAPGTWQTSTGPCNCTP